MRKIRLCDSDASFFDEEMMPGDYDFLSRHKDTFRRMWLEQGRTFWGRFVHVFRSYIVRYSLLGDLPCDISQLQNALDFAFVVINENFVNGKANQAKNLLYNIADLGRSKHKFIFLDSKSFTKDPFYTKDTRDIFREFFGPATEKSSYVRVYLLSPVYMRFGRSVVRCLELWKDAPEAEPSDDSYYVPPVPLENNKKEAPDSPQKGPILCQIHLDDCNMKYYQQFVVGSPNTPVALEIWGTGDPRRCEPGNPLYNPSSPLLSDWRVGLTCEKFQEFYIYCSNNFVRPEDSCPDCRSLAKKARKKLKKKLKKQIRSAEAGELSDEEERDSKPAERPKSAGKPSSTAHTGSHEPVHTCGKYSMNREPQTAAPVTGGSVLGGSGGPGGVGVDVGSSGGGSAGGGDNSSSSRVSKAVTASVNGRTGKRECFTSNSGSFRRQEEIKIPSPKQQHADGKVVFAVMNRSDPITGCKEVRVFVKEVMVSDMASTEGLLPKEVLGGSQPPALNADHIRELVPGLPADFHWAEGGNWCVASVDYTSVDAAGDKMPTKFILKISNSNIYVAKEANFALLKYVVQRKRRPSSGWVLTEDDVFTWFQGMKKEDVAALTMTIFTISTGMTMNDAITLAEEKTRTVLPGPDLSLQSQRAIEKEIDICNSLTKAWQLSKANENSVDFIDLEPEDGHDPSWIMPPSGMTFTNKVTTFQTSGALAPLAASGAAALTKKSAKGKKGKKAGKAWTPQPPAVNLTDIDPMTAALHNTLATISGNAPNLGAPQVINPTDLGLPEDCDVIGICAKGADGKNKYLLTARDPYDTKTAKVLKDLGYETIDFGLSQYDQPYTPPDPVTVGEHMELDLKGLDVVETKETASRPLSVCANCKVKEPVPKTYKKCQRCKEEAVIEARYYCGRTCQGEDWVARHREEHNNGTLH